MGSGDFQLVFLGTGAGCGVPSYFCECAACQEARSQPRYQRSRCAVLLQGEKNTLVDAPPELRFQLIREKVTDIDHFLLTHWHYDHTGGLGDLEFYVRTKRGEAIPAYMTADTLAWLRSAFWFMEDCLVIQKLEAEYQLQIDGFNITALDVQHTPGTIGLLFESPSGRRTAYIPDSGPLPQRTLGHLRDLDTLILDSTFWGANWMPDEHQSVDSAIQIGQELQAGQVYLTHLSMHHDSPVTNQALEAHLSQFGEQFHLAYDGLRIEL